MCHFAKFALLAVNTSFQPGAMMCLAPLHCCCLRCSWHASHTAAVQFLDLSWNGLEDPGCVALADALAENAGLHTLDLSNTRLGPAACAPLAKALRRNGALQMLFVNGNHLGEEGGRVLAKALTENRSLRYLGMQSSGQSVLPDSTHIDVEAVDEAHPEGTYNFDLTSAQERDVLDTLLRLDAAATAAHYAAGGDAAPAAAAAAAQPPPRRGALMQNAKVDGIPVKPAAFQLWPDALPAAGVLEFDFARVPGAAARAVLDGKKMYAIEREFQRASTTDDAKCQTVATLAPYSYLYASQVTRLLRHIGTGDQLVQARPPRLVLRQCNSGLVVSICFLPLVVWLSDAMLQAGRCDLAHDQNGSVHTCFAGSHLQSAPALSAPTIAHRTASSIEPSREVCRRRACSSCAASTWSSAASRPFSRPSTPAPCASCAAASAPTAASAAATPRGTTRCTSATRRSACSRRG